MISVSKSEERLKRAFEMDVFYDPFFIAEIGINHNGDIMLAKEMMISAKNAGANFAKFQYYNENSRIEIKYRYFIIEIVTAYNSD